jgi:hypothetical protein
MSTGYLISGTTAIYWHRDIAHIDNMTVTVGKKNTALGLVIDTHIAVEGKVIYRRLEDDGDIHFKIIDAAGNTLTCEIDPLQPEGEPALYQQVRVYGILRYDMDHYWFEIHPVDRWEDATVTPTLHVVA